MAEVSLYFMSGTGNTRAVAQWMAATAECQGVSCRIISANHYPPVPPMSAAQTSSQNSESGTQNPELGTRNPKLGTRNPELGTHKGVPTLLGLLMPTHGFIAPWMMIRFAWQLPAGGKTPAFVAVTRGGTKFGRVFLPGVEGTACYLMALILWLRGYRVRGVVALDMPVNWIAVHPGLRRETAEAIFARTRPKAERFMSDILGGRRRLIGVYEAIGLLLGLALLPISILYLLKGRFFLAKLFFANNQCNGCGQCARQCPVGAIKMQGVQTPRPYWTYTCESCMRCMAFCPLRAVEAGHSWAVALGYAASTAGFLFFFHWLPPLAHWVENFHSYWVESLILYPYFLASMALAYFLFSLLLRVPFLNAIFTHTTLTRYFRRYQAPETKGSDL
ncbi:MAG: EFR1 family ferrodoxin [Candidatus Sumerlaeota bacterium]|nr:EFR1 family ferrodoxin [Candidatus Sumerlaeota bacterium]